MVVSLGFVLAAFWLGLILFVLSLLHVVSMPVWLALVVWIALQFTSIICFIASYSKMSYDLMEDNQSKDIDEERRIYELKAKLEREKYEHDIETMSKMQQRVSPELENFSMHDN